LTCCLLICLQRKNRKNRTSEPEKSKKRKLFWISLAVRACQGFWENNFME